MSPHWRQTDEVWELADLVRCLPQNTQGPSQTQQHPGSRQEDPWGLLPCQSNSVRGVQFNERPCLPQNTRCQTVAHWAKDPAFDPWDPRRRKTTGSHSCLGAPLLWANPLSPSLIRPVISKRPLEPLPKLPLKLNIPNQYVSFL